MLLKNWMSRDVVTVDVNDSMQDATRLLKKHNIRGLPVIGNGKPVGIVTDRDLKRASASDASSGRARRTPSPGPSHESSRC